MGETVAVPNCIVDTPCSGYGSVDFTQREQLVFATVDDADVTGRDQADEVRDFTPS